ncbi:hypothetical protein D9615_006495 [Tricholomella constricta]|uniref:Uncharacterized protein n=1 Tax=Tricholomella constricta TaxID=117010 RepID=A0A8H5M3K2_9AGAR|nr:hypothetical protein D9615_006495 [Tricholomella constricta]
MTLHNSLPARRQHKARQPQGRKGPPPQAGGPFDGNPPDIEPTDTSQETGPTSSSEPSVSPTSSKPSLTRTTSPTTTKTTENTTRTPTPPTSTPTPTSTTISTSESLSSTQSEPSTSSTATSTLSSSSTTIARPVTITGAAVTRTQTSSFGTFTPTTTDALLTSSSASSTLAPSSGISTGAIVGSVAGGLAGIAIIGIIVAFFLRRWRRNRISDDDFNPDEFVRSPNMSETGYRASTFDPVPPNMAHRGHTVAPSIGSTNMAGQGAYPYNGGAGAGGSGAAIQERQMYTYGQGYDTNGARDDDISDLAHGGPYSSEPQMQATYNPEAYGSYAYSTEGHYATNPQQPHHPYSAQEYQAHYQDNAPPALVAGAPAVPAGRTAHLVDTDDAYGGI